MRVRTFRAVDTVSDLGRWIAVLAFVGSALVSATAVHAQDTLFNSDHAVLKCTMVYPLSWTRSLAEGKTEKYSSYELLGPKNAAGTFAARISVSATSATDAGFSSGVAQLDAFLDKMKTLAGQYQLIKRGNIAYWNESVPYIDFTYTMALPLASANPTWTIVRERRYAINHEGVMWTFSYAADATAFEKQEGVFQHMMDTFFFR